MGFQCFFNSCGKICKTKNGFDQHLWRVHGVKVGYYLVRYEEKHRWGAKTPEHCGDNLLIHIESHKETDPRVVAYGELDEIARAIEGGNFL
jgi:hypothetical protein